MKAIKAGLWASVAALAALSVACGGSDDDSGGDSADVVTGPRASAAEIAPGTYVFHGNGVGATLTVKSATATTLAYDIGIQVGSHIGDLSGRSATRSAGAAAYSDKVDADCVMTLSSQKADTIQVKQSGTCAEQGFGAFVDGSGTYTKKAAAPAPAPPSGSWVGLYETETTRRAWAIRITSQSPLTFNLFAGHLEDSSSRVDAKGLVGELQNDGVFFQKGPDCTIQMTKGDGSIHVTQTGTCEQIGFPGNDDLSMSDDQGTDFAKLDETKECFDKSKLAVSSSPTGCTSKF